MILVFWMLSFKPTFSLSSFTFIKRLFNSSLLSVKRVIQFSSVAQSCPTLCDPNNRSTPGLPVHHHCQSLPKPMSIESVMPSSSVIPFSSCPQSFPASKSFQMSQLFASVGQSIGVSASTSVLPMNTQVWSPLRWTGWISLQSKGLSRVFSNTTIQKHQFFCAQLFYSPTLTSIHDYWKNHSLERTDLCWQSDVSAF